MYRQPLQGAFTATHLYMEGQKNFYIFNLHLQFSFFRFHLLQRNDTATLLVRVTLTLLSPALLCSPQLSSASPSSPLLFFSLPFFPHRSSSHRSSSLRSSLLSAPLFSPLLSSLRSSLLSAPLFSAPFHSSPLPFSPPLSLRPSLFPLLFRLLHSPLFSFRLILFSSSSHFFGLSMYLSLVFVFFTALYVLFDQNCFMLVLRFDQCFPAYSSSFRVILHSGSIAYLYPLCGGNLDSRDHGGENSGA
ncbi:hypothetical protein BZA77DRAFT_166352 [Pyronema omphalodes]|nr:hypothetical protein BZA77DRAFT_166352 [Pyronema omphalodes]